MNHTSSNHKDAFMPPLPPVSVIGGLVGSQQNQLRQSRSPVTTRELSPKVVTAAVSALPSTSPLKFTAYQPSNRPTTQSSNLPTFCRISLHAEDITKAKEFIQILEVLELIHKPSAIYTNQRAQGLFYVANVKHSDLAVAVVNILTNNLTQINPSATSIASYTPGVTAVTTATVVSPPERVESERELALLAKIRELENTVQSLKNSISSSELSGSVHSIPITNTPLVTTTTTTKVRTIEPLSKDLVDRTYTISNSDSSYSISKSIQAPFSRQNFKEVVEVPFITNPKQSNANLLKDGENDDEIMQDKDFDNWTKAINSSENNSLIQSISSNGRDLSPPPPDCYMVESPEIPTTTIVANPPFRRSRRRIKTEPAKITPPLPPPPASSAVVSIPPSSSLTVVSSPILSSRDVMNPLPRTRSIADLSDNELILAAKRELADIDSSDQPSILSNVMETPLIMNSNSTFNQPLSSLDNFLPPPPSPLPLLDTPSLCFNPLEESLGYSANQNSMGSENSLDLNLPPVIATIHSPVTVADSNMLSSGSKTTYIDGIKSTIPISHQRTNNSSDQRTVSIPNILPPPLARNKNAAKLNRSNSSMTGRGRGRPAGRGVQKTHSQKRTRR